MKDGAPYCYTVGGTTGTVTMVNISTIKVDFDFPLDKNYTVNIADIIVIGKFDHSTARSGKIGAIKALRAFVPHLTLRDAKDIVESIGSVYSGDISDLRIRFDDLTAELERMRAEYNDLLTSVPTEKLIDLLRK